MTKKVWWRDGVIYQVYPRSFQDSDANGIGDLRGILERLDYLAGLGVDALWISPFYPSPMADFGYDVANYTDVDPLFGRLEDFDELIAAAHQRELKLILDFVPNHTSDQHPWFLASRSSKSDPKRDWYLWRDPAPDGGPPNNWQSNFGGPGWTFDATTGQFYYHSFLAQQPDLNWRNPDVRKAMYSAMRFWLDKGVDGFRMDVLWLLIKDDEFRHNPPNPDFTGGSSAWSVLSTYTADRPETHEIVREMRALLDSYSTRPDSSERILIGEIYLPIKQLVAYYGISQTEEHAPEVPQRLGAHMPFNFQLIQTAWQADAIATLIRDYEAELPPGAWPNWVLGNHDQKRLVSRIGADQARIAAVLLLTLRGTPTLYYGDELGMPDARIFPADIRDPAELNQPGIGMGRDPERSPMLWNNRENAGFTAPGVRTWLPLVWDWPQFTVESQSADKRSMLCLYRCLLDLRRSRPSLHAGTITDVRAQNGVLSYLRISDDQAERTEVHLNFTEEERTIECHKGRILMSSALDIPDTEVGWDLRLRGNEAIIIQLAV